MANNIISICFIALYSYITINTISFILYKRKIKENSDFYRYFYNYIITEKKFLYIFFTVIMIIYNKCHKDEIKLNFYNQRKTYMMYNLDYNLWSHRDSEYYNSEIAKMNSNIRKIELRIKIKKLNK